MGGAVEDREKAVSRGGDLLTAMAPELVADSGMMGAQDGAPAAVPELHRPLGRADEVGEQHGGDHATGLQDASPVESQKRGGTLVNMSGMSGPREGGKGARADRSPSSVSPERGSPRIAA
jgi:hypothetical protein